jgi:hypothetical protein
MAESSYPHSAAEHSQTSHQPPSSGEGGETSATLEEVLESECIALLALEASRARMRFLPGDFRGVDADIGGAIDLLRHAIAELRALVSGTPPSLLALGFVARQDDLGRPR